MEYEGSLLILDDLKARKLAKMLGLSYTGTLGVINKAKSLGFIKEVRPIIEKLKTSGFRMSQNVIDALLKKNNE
jgi:predicted nucleic acid-binding protein